MSQLLAHIQDLQNQVNSMSDAREFNDPDTASSSGASQVPSQHLTIPSSRGMPRRDSGLPPFTRNTLGTPGKVFESLLLKKDHPQLSSKNSTNLASSSCGLRPETTGKTLVQEREVKREPLNSSIPVPRFPRGAGVLDHTGGTYSHNSFQLSEP